jgi:hypothetical protein
MKYGFVMPAINPHEVVDTAVKAEQAGWDAFFLADSMWSVDVWPRPKSMRRVLQCDGIVPVVKPKGEEERVVTPNDVREIKAWLQEQRDTPLDIVVEGQMPEDDPDEAQAIIHSWATAGATWWIKSVWDNPTKRANRLLQGPPPFAR